MILPWDKDQRVIAVVPSIIETASFQHIQAFIQGFTDVIAISADQLARKPQLKRKPIKSRLGDLADRDLSKFEIDLS